MKMLTKYRRAAAVLSALCLILGLAGCGSGTSGSTSGKDAYQAYVISIMDANYLGKYDQYMEITGSAEAEAQKIYEANVQDFALEMEDAFSIKQDVVSVALTERVIGMAKTVYSQAKYQAVDVIRDGDTYTVSVEIEPIDFFGTIKEPFRSAVDAFNLRAKNGEFDNLTNEEYEEAYGEAVVAALEGKLSPVTYASKIKVDITLDYDKDNNVYVISDEQMEGLDDKVVNMSR